VRLRSIMSACAVHGVHAVVCIAARCARHQPWSAQATARARRCSRNAGAHARRGGGHAPGRHHAVHVGRDADQAVHRQPAGLSQPQLFGACQCTSVSRGPAVHVASVSVVVCRACATPVPCGDGGDDLTASDVNSNLAVLRSLVARWPDTVGPLVVMFMQVSRPGPSESHVPSVWAWCDGQGPHSRVVGEGVPPGGHKAKHAISGGKLWSKRQQHTWSNGEGAVLHDLWSLARCTILCTQCR